MLKILGAASALLMLAACTPNQVQTSLNDLKTGCGALAIAEQHDPLTGGAAATEAKVKAPFDAFCAIVDSGVVPGNADANSLAWVQAGANTVGTIVAFNKAQ